jgi:hypothetical protein
MFGPPKTRLEVIDFARFLLVQQDDAGWQRLVAEEKSRPRLDQFLKASATEVDEPRDL